MAYTTIDKSDDYFNTKLYTGNGSTQTISGLDFAPDWVWLKDRTSAYNHVVFDKVRGVEKRIFPNLTNAEDTAADTLTAFNSDGFAIGNNVGINTNTNNYVSWNWLANGAGVSNTAGSITSTVSANTTSGFSIVSYTGTGANATVGHGLGSAPKMVIFKNRDDGTQEWDTYHIGLTDATYFIQLNSSNAQSNTNGTWRFNSTAPSSSVFSVGTSTTTNASGEDIIAYCFADVKGYSKFGSYTGNGNADGTFVYTGFKPAFVLMKRTTTASYSWIINDNKRNIYNPGGLYLQPDTTLTESGPLAIDFLSNGFKQRNNSNTTNASGVVHIYMAFAENPFVTSTSIPTTAR
jgi:hypothetical protein